MSHSVQQTSRWHWLSAIEFLRKHFIFDIKLLIHTKIHWCRVFLRNMQSSWCWRKRRWRAICNYGTANYTTTSRYCLKTFWFALCATKLCIICVFLICTLSCADNNFWFALWVALRIMTLKFDYHSPEQIGGLLWLSGWSKNANSGEEFSPKFDFNIYLRVKSFLIISWKRDLERSAKKTRKKVWTVGSRHWILFWQMGQNYADILAQREKI